MANYLADKIIPYSLLPLFETRALDLARLCQQAMWLWPLFYRPRFTPIGSQGQEQFCDCLQ